MEARSQLQALAALTLREEFRYSAEKLDGPYSQRVWMLGRGGKLAYSVDAVSGPYSQPV
jgi:hypothetical protein